MLNWRKSWIDENLEGSIRKDLKPEERSVWADLLDLCGKSRRWGHIERSTGIPYTSQELAEKFVTPIKVINSTIRKCLKEGRLRWEHATENPLVGSGAFIITNWDRYQKDNKKEPDSKKPPLSPEEKQAQEQVLAAKLAYRQPDAALRGAALKLEESEVNAVIK